MPTEMTAALYLSPTETRALLPTQVMILCEGFRPVWTGHSLLVSGRPPQAAARVTAGAPGHQLAHGLVAYLWMTSPALLAADPDLASLMTTSSHGVTSVPLRATDAHRIYAAVAPIVRADLSLHARTCVSDRDITHAQRCGLRLTVADARPHRLERSA